MRSSLALALLLAPSLALAQSRPLTTTMTCKAVQSLIQSRQAVVLNTSPTLFDRYVANDGQCLVDQESRPAFAPTSDNPQCLIGLRCVELEINQR
jgi:hypothetical protein